MQKKEEEKDLIQSTSFHYTFLGYRFLQVYLKGEAKILLSHSK